MGKLENTVSRERGKMKKRKTGTGVDGVYVEDYVTPKTTQSNLEVNKIIINLDHVVLP